MFFDADEGVLVYLENVKVSDPRFTLTGAKELKIFFDREQTQNNAASEKTAGLGANFGDVKKLIATGAVRILQKGVGGKEPVEASGALLNYNIQNREIIISGGFPWVKQGNLSPAPSPPTSPSASSTTAPSPPVATGKWAAISS